MRTVIFVLLSLVAVEAWAVDLRRQSVPIGTRVSRDLAYVPDGHRRQTLDLYSFAAGEPRPLVIWVHPGAWMNLDKSEGISLELLSRGYAMASLNYRLSQHATFPAQIEDCKAAVRWLRANATAYNLDPERFAAWGSSAGGHLVAMLGASGDVQQFDVGPNLEHSSRVQAVVDLFGPTDFRSMPFSRYPDSPEAMLLGGRAFELPNRAAAASPISYVTPDDPPFLILHGDRDTTVPPRQSELLHKALTDAQVDATFVVVPGVSHQEMEIWRHERPRILRFLDQHLRPGEK